MYHTLIATILLIIQAPSSCRTPVIDQHLGADRGGEQGTDVAVVGERKKREQSRGEGQEHDAGKPAFGGEGLDVAEQLVPLADQPADLVEHLGEVAAGGALNDDRDHEEPDVHDRDAIGHVAERQLDGDAEVLLLEHAVELVGDRPLHLLGHQVQPRGQAVPGRSARLISSTASGIASMNFLIRFCFRLRSQRNGKRAEEARGRRDGVEGKLEEQAEEDAEDAPAPAPGP